MFGRSALYRLGSVRPENLGQNAVSMIGNACFTAFVIGVLVFTFIAATYEPEDPLFHPSTKMTDFLTSTSSATFKADKTVVKTGEDFTSTNQTAFSNFINTTDVDADASVSGKTSSTSDCHTEVGKPIDCSETEVFHLLMRTCIEKFDDIHFYKFGKPVDGGNDTTCDMAWRFRPKNGKTAAFYKDYRRFHLSRSPNCTTVVVGVGGYHTGVHARKRGRNQKPGFEKPQRGSTKEAVTALPVVGEVVNDSLPVVESGEVFSRGKYLFYTTGGDRCKSMDHYLWSFLCALGEARYLNRTLIMDPTICLSSKYTSSNRDEEGKDFRLYFDFEHLKESMSVLDSEQFWANWRKWQGKHRLTQILVEDVRVTPMKLKGVGDRVKETSAATLVLRKFGRVEPDNYWYRVCEGETESVVERPWHLLWKSRRLMDIVSVIASRLQWDFDAVNVVRGEKAKNKQLWPSLEADTSPASLMATLGDKVEEGRRIYVTTNEADRSFFDPLKKKYSVYFIEDFRDLWDEKSEWHMEAAKLSPPGSEEAVEFDGYMRVLVDTEVFLRGKKQIETFNDLTTDCKDGINTCTTTLLPSQ